jgi:hypothetical protein
MRAKSSLGEFERKHICQKRSALLLQHAVVLLQRCYKRALLLLLRAACVLYYMCIYIVSAPCLYVCVCVCVCIQTHRQTDRHIHT